MSGAPNNSRTDIVERVSVSMPPTMGTYDGGGGKTESHPSESSSSSCPSGSRIIADCVDTVPRPPIRRNPTCPKTASRSDTENEIWSQPNLIDHPLRPSVNFTLRVIDKFEYKAVSHQVRRMHSERLDELQKLITASSGTSSSHQNWNPSRPS